MTAEAEAGGATLMLGYDHSLYQSDTYAKVAKNWEELAWQADSQNSMQKRPGQALPKQIHKTVERSWWR